VSSAVRMASATPPPAGARAPPPPAECHARPRAELPYDGWRLSRGEPAVPTKTVDIFEGDD